MKLVMGTGSGWLEVLLFGESEMIVSALGNLCYITGRYLFGRDAEGGVVLIIPTKVDKDQKQELGKN